MKPTRGIGRRLRRQEGQALPLVAIWMVVLLGFAALVIDIGRLYVAQEQLQAAVNSAALAAGNNLPNATNAYSAAVSYSAATGDKNTMTGYGVSAASPTVTFECNAHAPNDTSGTCPTDTSNTSCHPSGSANPASSTCNAVVVSETATVQTTFAGLFNLPKWTISDSAIAAARGGYDPPLDVEVIMDNTQSMVSSSCSGTVTGIPSGDATQLDCAKAGVGALLQTLWPCNEVLNGCGTATANSGTELGNNVPNPVDKVGLLVFPEIGTSPSISTLDEETNCNTTGNGLFTPPEYPQWSSYTPPNIPSGDQNIGYQAVSLSSDYRNSDASSSTPNYSTSPLAESIYWDPCTTSEGSTPAGNYPANGQDPYDYGLKDVGGQGTYLAGAVTEAQYLLQTNARAGAKNVIIIESDGQMNAAPVDFANGTKSETPCLDAYNAANLAKEAGTQIYAIEYGTSSTSGTCGHDSPTDIYDNPGTLMADMATSSETYFDDPTAGNLTATFTQVGEDLTEPRLIPQCTHAAPSC
jgi:hypothetical protein